MAPASSFGTEKQSLYQQRLRTFSPVTYFAKPNSLSPLVCARFGFENVGTDMLQCVACQAAIEISVAHTTFLSARARLDLTCQLEEQLAVVHGETCPFRHEAEKLYLPLQQQHNAIDDEEEEEELIVPMWMAQVLPTNLLDWLDSPRPLSLVAQQWQQMMQQIMMTMFPTSASASSSSSSGLGLKLPREIVDWQVQDNDNRQHDDNDFFSRLVGIVRNRTSQVRTDDSTSSTATTTTSNNETLEKEVLVLVLLGWSWRTKKSLSPPPTNPDESSSSLEDSSCQWECPVCWARLSLSPPPGDRAGGGGATTTTDTTTTAAAAAAASEQDSGETASPHAKRARFFKSPVMLKNPLQCHRHYCPFVCGFPCQGQASATPLWQSVMHRLHHQQQQVIEKTSTTAARQGGGGGGAGNGSSSRSNSTSHSGNQQQQQQEYYYKQDQKKTPAASRLDIHKLLQSGISMMSSDKTQNNSRE